MHILKQEIPNILPQRTSKSDFATNKYFDADNKL